MGEGVGICVVRALRAVLTYALVAVLCLPLLMGCYALWDSHMVYDRAESTQWQPYKPTEPEPLSFWELQRINPEVQAWLSVYGTNIDYPVCQSAPDQESKYLTTTPTLEYSLSGSLFVDVRNAADFSDFATIVYGHHMENAVMFGQITDFAQKEYFDDHRYGNLFVANKNHGLEFFCYLDADAYDASIYRRVPNDESEQEGFLDLLRERAGHWRSDVEVSASDRIVLLSTCASGGTNARAILVGKVCHKRFKDPFTRIPNFGTGVDELEGWLGVPSWCWFALVCFVLLFVVIVLLGRAKRSHE